MKILNLYAGIGGNRKLWDSSRHEITAVELNPIVAKIYQAQYPQDEVIIADAHKFLLENYQDFDFIWSSPPCQSHSRVRFAFGVKSGKTKPVYPDMRLYQEVLLLKHHFAGLYVVENVKSYYQPLLPPQILGRHYYWANFDIIPINVQTISVATATTTSGRRLVAVTNDELEHRLGIRLSDVAQRLNLKLTAKIKKILLHNCVEPKIGQYILDCALWDPETMVQTESGIYKLYETKNTTSGLRK